MKTKWCPDCKLEKFIHEFGSGINKDGLSSYCRSCKNARSKKSPNYNKNIRNSYLKKNYGIDEDEYERMFDAQDGVCAICRLPETRTKKSKSNDLNQQTRLAIDHDHKTGNIRGLLCYKCNVGLGYFQDDATRLNKAIWYLGLTKE